MSISEKASTIASNNATIKTNVQKVYDAGYTAGKAEGGGLFTYASRPSQLFYEVDFGGRDEIEIVMPNIGNANISEMFAKAKGYNRLTALFAPEVAYNGYRFIQGLSTGGSSIEELTMIDDMKFSRFDGFAQYCINLTTINGRIDLSGCTTTGYLNQCFLSCSALVNVSFMPNSITLNISFANSPNLSNASIDSIIKGLANLKGKERQTVGFHSTVLENLTDDQYEEIEGKNWGL